MPTFPRHPAHAAALVQTGTVEPRVTLYTEYWRQAREYAARLRPSRGGAVWRRLLEHQERGWEFVRPLALAVEAAERAKAAGEPADPENPLYRFADLEIVDLYRYNAFRCADMVLAPHGSALPSTDDIDGDVDAFLRYVSLLRMASTHPLAPLEFRGLAAQAAGVDGWHAEFADIFEPATEVYYRHLRKMGYWGV